MKLKMTHDDWFKGYSERDMEDVKAYEAQLLHTATMIQQMVEVHPHFSDDCGDYLSAALDLSNELTEAITLYGVSGLKEAFQNTVQRWDEIACDGISPDVSDHLEKYYGLGEEDY